MRTSLRFILASMCGVTVLAWPFADAQAAQAKEFVIGAKAVRDHGQISPEHVQIVEDPDAWNGLAILIEGGVAGSPPPTANPQAWFRIGFVCEPGTYFLWLHGKTDVDSQADSVWVQFDDEIGTTAHRNPGAGMANWLDFVGAGTWEWGADMQRPWSFTFDQGGPHTMLVQPRQVPHFIDQFWFSEEQDARPDDPEPVDGLDEPVLSVSPHGMLAIAWCDLKSIR